MKVAAIIVTRGDQQLQPVLASLPEEWDVLVWDNGAGQLRAGSAILPVPDMAVYGRYAAIEYTDASLIYVQDDDCVVSDPQALVDIWRGDIDPMINVAFGQHHVVCNMPQEFRHEFYEEHALVGFGAAFHRDAPQRAFSSFFASWAPGDEASAMFNRTCDIVFTALTPRVLVDVPKEDLPFAFHLNRMWRQPKHQYERTQMLDLVRKVRGDGARWPDDFRGFGTNVRPPRQP